MFKTIAASKRSSHNYYSKSLAGIAPLLLLQVLVLLSSSSSFSSSSSPCSIFCSSFTPPSVGVLGPGPGPGPGPGRIGVSSFSSSIIIMSATNKPSGSFFNKVPDKDDDNDDKDANQNDDIDDNKNDMDDNLLNNNDNNQDPFDQSLQQLIKSRTSKPRASSPSTMGGIPTSKFKGFGKSTASPQQSFVTKVNTPGSKKPFIGIGKPLNDINKPEYDDQGYTLYADEETGEKSRVFEALVEYPSIFKLKIIGVNESSFSTEMIQIVAETCQVEAGRIKYTERVNGKWLSVTVHAPVESAEMLYALYENVDKDPRVKFKF